MMAVLVAAATTETPASTSMEPSQQQIVEEEALVVESSGSATNAPNATAPSLPMTPLARIMSSELLTRLIPTVRWSPTALALASTTPWLARAILPTVCLLTHALFYYGQTAAMWKLRVNADIDVWANATAVQTKQAFHAAGLKYEQHYTYKQDNDVQTFTYYYAIHHLWIAQGIPGKVLPRMGAVLLILFSGVWPHMKLVWLQATWFFSKQARNRTTTLQWLSTLGKWSLADVLVICVMVGVLNLDWLVDPDAIKNGVISDLPAIIEIVQSQYDESGLCNKLLKVHCQDAKNVVTKAKCEACTQLVLKAYTRPEWAKSMGKTILNGVDTSGGGFATLRVVGMSGIYAFCGAVIMSIVLSLMVDIFDHRAKQELRKQQERDRVHDGLGRIPATHQSISESGRSGVEDSMEEPLLGAGSTTIPLELDIGEEDQVLLPPRLQPTLFSCRFLFSTLFTTVLVLFAVDWYTMERRVYGAGPQLLHDILGVDWERNYSLTSLMWTTGAHGGWDYMLMGTFGLFCVVGPVLRAVLVVGVTLMDRCHLPVEPLANLVNFVGAFCSWEVFAIAIVMVQMLMPSITNTIIHNKVCAEISDDGSCLQVEFNILPTTFWTILVGGVSLVAISCIAVSRGTDRNTDLATPSNSNGTTRMGSGVHAMSPSHDYQRLPGNGRVTAEGLEGDALEEFEFVTNQV